MKKVTEKVRCIDCSNSIGEPVNFIIGCSSVKANPMGVKKGTFLRVCKFFEKRLE